MLLDRYRCVDYATHLQCQARVFLEDGVYIPTGDHNRGNKEQYIYNLNFENALKSACIHFNFCLRFSRATLTFYQMQSTMNEVRRIGPP